VHVRRRGCSARMERCLWAGAKEPAGGFRPCKPVRRRYPGAKL
jgi:hypothetical protein